MKPNKETELHSAATPSPPKPVMPFWFVLETLLIFLLFAIYGVSATPGENEAHYLTKAKHYWNPAWCPTDHFLNSADAHAVFYWTYGWMTRLFSLTATAWIGRVLTWLLLAWSWGRLSRSIAPRPGLALLSAGLFACFVANFHMAGEWVLGGVEAKGFAYVLVFLAIEALLKNRWTAAWLMLGAATSFHVLVGGWSLVASVMAWLACSARRPSFRVMVLSMFGATLLALPGLVPALSMSWGVPADVMRDANAIHVYERLPHHLLFHRFAYAHSFPLFYVLRHMLLLTAWLLLGFLTPCTETCGVRWQRPIRGFVGGAVAIAFVGAFLDQTLLFHQDLAASVLKYYWFRMSDSLLPVGVALAWTGAVERWWTEIPGMSRKLAWLGVAIATLGLGAMANEKRRELAFDGPVVSPPWLESASPDALRVTHEWRLACEWLRDHSPADSVCITPRWQQSFKWFAERSEIVTWKDVPQDAPSVVQWWRRLGEIHPPEVSVGGIAALPDERLRELAQQYSANYIVADHYLGSRKLEFEQIYPAIGQPMGSFVIYRVAKE